MEEKMRILKMVEDGKLTAEQAIPLLTALEDTTAKEEPTYYAKDADNHAFTAGYNKTYEFKMFKIIVDSPAGDKVNVQLPVKIVRQLLKMTGKLPIQTEKLQGIDLDALTSSILDCISNEMLGDIVQVDSSDGTKVRVYIQ